MSKRIANLQSQISFLIATKPPGWYAKVKELEKKIRAEKMDY